MNKHEKYFCKKMQPGVIRPDLTLNELVDRCFTSFNGRAFRDACRLFTGPITEHNTTVGWSLAGALVPAGLGQSCLVPLIKNGVVDWMISTGANLYHDLHFCLGYSMYEGSAAANDCQLREDDVVRIHDIFFESDALFDTDKFIRDVFRENPLSEAVSSADIHRRIGDELLKRWPNSHEFSVLAAAALLDVPVHTSSPGDSSTGMNLAALALEGIPMRVDPNSDVNLTAAWVYDAKKSGGKTAAVILGGGSPKNFLLQTEPHIQEVLGLQEAGHDFFIQFTDARVDTGGLSGATPSEAVSWGKIDPSQLSSTLVCYGDCTVYLPLFTSYILNSKCRREPKRLWRRGKECLERLTNDYRNSSHWMK
ncbi:MAG: deoxyhypusine synthase [Candidatus Omnitrophota bacterium]|jgi:deoxyhypusine synthase|nr:MAG: deoxyhypusine synthase [Candidatus Omnitrophota bacterium]